MRRVFDQREICESGKENYNDFLHKLYTHRYYVSVYDESSFEKENVLLNPQEKQKEVYKVSQKGLTHFDFDQNQFYIIICKLDIKTQRPHLTKK
jgi:hypothetical protein